MLGEVVRYFFRLGVIAFGGPAAHVALMRRELVRERAWLSDQELMDHVGAANLIPGPNSTELAMHLGAHRAGWKGLWLGGLAFIVPAVAIVLVLAWGYVEYGGTPAGEGIILGIQPFILAIIVQAIWGLRTAAVKGAATIVAAAAVLVLAILGVNEILLILGTGGAMLARAALRRRGGGGEPGGAGGVRKPARGGVVPRRAARPWERLRREVVAWRGLAFAAAPTPPGYSIGELFWVFLKIGSILYGSGYVLLAFLQADLVDQRGWLTEEQLVDAIAVGQFTPGPLFSSATFAGYVIDGWQGALAATLGIFLPSFVLVTVTHPFVPRLRKSPWAAPFLDGVNVAALALMAVVTVQLGREVLDGWYTIALFVAAAFVLVRFNPNSAWLVLAGIAAGLAHAWVA